MGLVFESIVTDILAVAIVVLTAVYWWLTQNNNYWQKRGVPTTKQKSLLFGSMSEVFLLKRSVALFFQNMYNEHPDARYIGFYKMKKPSLLIRDPELIKNILVKDFKSFHDNTFLVDEKRDPVIANHLFVLSGWKWKYVRTRVTPAFTTGKIKHMFPLMTETCEDLMKFIAKNNNGDSIDAKALASRFKIDVSALCAFGVKSNALNDEDSVFKRMGIGFLNSSKFKVIVNLIVYFSPELMQFLKMTFVPEKFGNFLKSLIADMMELRKKKNISRPDFINTLMELKEKGAIKEEHDDGEHKLRSGSADVYDVGDKKIEWTPDVLAGSLMGFVGDGFETTSTLISFALIELANHPHVQEKLIQEMDEVLEKYDGKVFYEALYEMPYLEKVFCEILRKYPPIALMMRKCTENYQVPDSDLVIVKGTPVTIPIYSLHMDPTYWPEPDKFDPERFSPENKKKIVPSTYLPFSDGPRTCVGNRFGNVQVKAALIYIFQQYTIRPSEKTSYPVKLSPNIAIHPTEGIHVYFEPRSKYTSMGLVFESLVTDILAVAIVALTAVYWWLTQNNNYWQKLGVPTTKQKSILFGSLSEILLLKRSVALFFQAMYNEHPDARYIGFYKLKKPALLIKDPELVKNVLSKDFKSFHDNAYTADEKRDPVFANHLAILTGWKWKYVRTRINPAFTIGKVRHMFPLMMEICEDLMNFIEMNLKGDSIDAKAMAARFKIDVAALCAFGVKSNALNEKDSVFKRLGIGLFNASKLKVLINIFMYFSPETMSILKMKFIPEKLCNFMKSLIADMMELRKKKNITRPDFINMLMELKKKGTIKEEHEDGEHKLQSDSTDIYDSQSVEKKFDWTLDVFAGSLMGFIGDGFETTSTVISFALIEIANHPHVQEKLIQELDEVLEKYDGKVFYEVLLEMPYMEQVISEILRKYPPLALVLRQCTEDYRVPDSDLVIAKGTPVTVPIYSLHNDPKYWPEPDKFDPERFSPENKKKIVPFSYIPFSEGPRICIGYKFGQVQIKAALISILKQYTIRPSEKTSYPVKLSPSLAIHPMEGIHVYFEPRSK
ncbi:uncharacterized protein LOC132204601 [Neocloeon triangulifer]|uniref:uncharacterized protein LOC132204601 n=1 Tax=Neocloeon triangulifer TaxID=2078957 RepID=UPI00286F7181|nr:uncharacterized protein LOC132204601 [Neocloeon triangulifer]